MVSNTQKVKQFCYLGDTLDGEGGVERTVRTHVAKIWKKWRNGKKEDK